MALCNSIDIRRTLSSLIPARWLEETAREVKFIQRDRKIDPWAFVWTLVLGFGLSKSRSFSGLVPGSKGGCCYLTLATTATACSAPSRATAAISFPA